MTAARTVAVLGDLPTDDLGPWFQVVLVTDSVADAAAVRADYLLVAGPADVPPESCPGTRVVRGLTELHRTDLLTRLDGSAAERIRVIADAAEEHLAHQADLVRRADEAQRRRIAELEGRSIRSLLRLRRTVS